jgi:hypothetical protein
MIGPRTPVRGEHLEVVAAGRGHRPGRDDRDRVHRPQRDPPLPALPLQPLPATSRVGADVAGQHQPVGVDLGGEPERLLDRVAASQHQVTAPLPQALAQVGQALVQEAGAVGHGEPQPLVHHEQRHDVRRRANGQFKGRVVVDAQVPGEKDDRGPQPRYVARCHVSPPTL